MPGFQTSLPLLPFVVAFSLCLCPVERPGPADGGYLGHPQGVGSPLGKRMSSHILASASVPSHGPGDLVLLSVRFEILVVVPFVPPNLNSKLGVRPVQVQF